MQTHFSRILNNNFTLSNPFNGILKKKKFFAAPPFLSGICHLSSYFISVFWNVLILIKLFIFVFYFETVIVYILILLKARGVNSRKSEMWKLQTCTNS